ncbi:MAG: diguanylate cyclase [Proteobacteria bacterium]|nr:diguanylate cyclase [Pseudomonadota bacterium]
MTPPIGKRPCFALLLWAVLAGFFPGAAAHAKTASAPLTMLWDAPRGPAASDDALRWLTKLRDAVSRPRAGCDRLALPDLSLSKPARALQLKVDRQQRAGRSPIVYLQDPIAEIFMVVATDVRGCPSIFVSGRALPFAQRAIISPFPNARLPDLPEGAVITAIVQDFKTIRPWIMLADETRFVRENALLWVGAGVYSGLLLMMIVVALGFGAYAGSRVASAYALYCLALQVWLVQNFGIGAACFSSWPGPQSFPLLQAISVAGVVLGVGLAVLEFLRLRGRARAAVGGFVVLSALGFLASAWHAAGYRVGAAILSGLALATIVQLARAVVSGDASIRLFTLGLGATMIGGGVQAFSVIGTGLQVNRLAAFAFPLGSLVQAAFWLAALIIRRQRELNVLRAEQAQARLADTVRQVGADLNSTLELPEVLDRLLGHVARFVRFDQAVVFALEGEGIRVVASRGFAAQQLPSGPVPLDELRALSKIARSGEQVLCTPTSPSPGEGHYLGLQRVSSWLALPLRARDEVIGILALDRRTGEPFSERDLDLVNTFTGTAGVAAQNARLFGETRSLATTDGLTGLLNRTHFFHLAEQELRRCRRLGGPVSVLMVDVDHFKRINDRYGHQAGDLVLARVGECLKTKIREMDLVGRYGGEEFAALLPQTPPPLAREVGERIRRTIEALSIMVDGQTIPVTLSVGVAGRAQPDDLPALLRQADAALYQAKSAGRNRVVVATEEAPPST